MRLLNIHTRELKVFLDPKTVPKYAIASHRWSEDETTFQDVYSQRNTTTSGYLKVQSFCSVLRSLSSVLIDVELEWLWIDTCCIDKTCSAELSQAINSMFRWYSEALFCIVYLRDVKSATKTRMARLSDLENSCWFTRGWTLQELIAPADVIFLDDSWTVFGHKCSNLQSPFATDNVGSCLNSALAQITKIPREVLDDNGKIWSACLGERKSWLAGRTTTLREDMAYCMQGILGVYLPPIYGEGSHSWVRLEEILRSKMVSNQAELTAQPKAVHEGHSSDISTPAESRRSWVTYVRRPSWVKEFQKYRASTHQGNESSRDENDPTKLDQSSTRRLRHAENQSLSGYSKVWWNHQLKTPQQSIFATGIGWTPRTLLKE